MGTGVTPDTRRGQAAIRAFPLNFVVHISAIPLGTPTLSHDSAPPQGADGRAVQRERGLPLTRMVGPTYQ